MSKTRVSDAAAFGAALLAYLVFYLTFFAQSLNSGTEIAPSDALDFGLATFLSPTTVWTDAMYSGYPIIADPQSLSWYPVFQLMRALGFSWTLFEISGYVIASATAFLLVRRVTASTIAGLFSGVVFGFSGIMLAHINHFNQVHAAAWLPLVVYGLLLVRTDHHREGAVIGALALELMWTAGHPQLVVYGAYLCAALIVGWVCIDHAPVRITRRRLLWWGVAAVLGTALAAIVVLPGAELGSMSRRAEADWNLYNAQSMPPSQLLTLIFPMAFGGFSPGSRVDVPYVGAASLVEMGGYPGLLPLGLAVLAIIKRSTLRREARLWVGLGIVALILCLGPATPLGKLFFFAPGYARFRGPARHLFIVAFCFSIASGIGFAHFVRDPKGHVRVTAAALIAIFLCGLVGMAMLSASSGSVLERLTANPNYLRWAVGLPFATCIVLVASTWTASVASVGTAATGLLLLTVHMSDMLVVHYMLPGYHFAYAHVGPNLWQLRPEMAALRDELRKSGGRVLAADGSHNPLLRPNLTRAWDVPAASGSGSLAIERYANMFRMGGPGDVGPETMLDAHRSLDLFAIQYVLLPDDSRVVQDLLKQPVRWQQRASLKPGYLLFHNARSLARAWCVADVFRTDDPLGPIREGRLPDGRVFDPSTTALIDVGALPHWHSPSTAPGGSSVTVKRLPGREGEYDVDAGSSECLLVFSEVRYPWWRASIDGTPANPLRVNYAMFGIVLSSGHHIVRLWIEPRSVWIGGAISAMALVAWIMLAARSVRASRRLA